jgi:N-acetyl sugar amidotransferase
MNDIYYCKQCVYPSSKPHIEFNEDRICSGCIAYNNRPKIDWRQREENLKKILTDYKNRSPNYYHCIVPSSGGKDSYYQTIKMLEYGLNPLVVNVVPDKLAEIGRHNMENMRYLGVDTIQISLNPIIRRKINKFSLETVGDISWPEHISIFTVPVKVSVNMKIPLLIWGESAENENGGPMETLDNNILNRRWLEEFGGLLGLRANDISNILQIPEEKLIQYTYPSEKELKETGSLGLFLGQFIPWDGAQNAAVAKKYGFKSYEKNVEGSIVDYENLDNVYMRVHDYFKFLKYGYDRVTDWCSWHIRRKRLTREEAVKINQEKSGKFPDVYLGYPLSKILEEIKITKEEFINICDKFTNKSLFLCNNKNELIKDKDGNLILKRNDYK